MCMVKKTWRGVVTEEGGVEKVVCLKIKSLPELTLSHSQSTAYLISLVNLTRSLSLKTRQRGLYLQVKKPCASDLQGS